MQTPAPAGAGAYGAGHAAALYCRRPLACASMV